MLLRYLSIFAERFISKLYLIKIITMDEIKYPMPPFTLETALQKAQNAEDGLKYLAFLHYCMIADNVFSG